MTRCVVHVRDRTCLRKRNAHFRTGWAVAPRARVLARVVRRPPRLLVHEVTGKVMEGLATLHVTRHALPCCAWGHPMRLGSMGGASCMRAVKRPGPSFCPEGGPLTRRNSFRGRAPSPRARMDRIWTEPRCFRGEVVGRGGWLLFFVRPREALWGKFPFNRVNMNTSLALRCMGVVGALMVSLVGWGAYAQRRECISKYPCASGVDGGVIYCFAVYEC